MTCVASRGVPDKQAGAAGRPTGPTYVFLAPGSLGDVVGPHGLWVSAGAARIGGLGHFGHENA